MEVKRRIRILYTIPNFDTAGSGKALLNIALRLNRELFEPLIACESNAGTFFKAVTQSGIPVHVFKLTTPMNRRLSGLKNIVKIARHFGRIRPDIVHSFHYSADYSEALAARLAGCKWVYTKKNMSWGGSSKNSWRLRTWLANRIVAQNTDMIRLFFSKSEKVSLIPRGVLVEEFEGSKSNSQKIKNELGLSLKSKIILSVANLVPVKGIEVLIKAFNTIYEQFPEVNLIIVGDDANPYAQSLKQLAAANDARSQIYFMGKRTDVKDFLAAADIFVLPTLNQGRQEGSPVALIEAMAAGKYVLASDVAGVRDQLRNFSAHLFEPGNNEMLANKLLACLALSDYELRHFGKEFRNHIVNNYTIEGEVSLHEQLYFDVSD
jgi:glycosyltransferase involved in cell wall biosynthesis